MSDKKYPSDGLDQFRVRLPSGMRDKIAEAAKANGRSMNAEFIARLEQTFENDQKDRDMRGDEPLANILKVAEGLMDASKALEFMVTMEKIRTGEIKVDEE